MFFFTFSIMSKCKMKTALLMTREYIYDFFWSCVFQHIARVAPVSHFHHSLQFISYFRSEIRNIILLFLAMGMKSEYALNIFWDTLIIILFQPFFFFFNQGWSQKGWEDLSMLYIRFSLQLKSFIKLSFSFIIKLPFWCWLHSVIIIRL